jgi:RNA polymerase sigma factor (TIGR02999 family)
VTDTPASEVTTLLGALRAGDPAAQERLVQRVYADLRELAAGLMRRERTDHTLEPTALVHEAVLRLLDQDALPRAPNRRYLLAAAARAMRQVLVDHARTRQADKRGGGLHRQPLDDVLEYFSRQKLDVLAVHDALDRLARLDERQSQVVALRVFGGLTLEEVAEQLDVSVATVGNDFRMARAWLRRELAGDAP